MKVLVCWNHNTQPNHCLPHSPCVVLTLLVLIANIFSWRPIYWAVATWFLCIPAKVKPTSAHIYTLMWFEPGTMTHNWVPLKPYSSAICVLLICRLFLSLVHTSWKLAGNCLLICHPQADRDSGDGIVLYGKRLSISLVFPLIETQKQQQRWLYTAYVCWWGWVTEHESALWWQIISCLFYCDHLSVCVCVCACVCAHLAHRVSVLVLPHSSLSAAYQFTMATNGAPLTAAGLMSVVTAHCQPIIINLITTHLGNRMVSKRPSGDPRFPFLPRVNH